MTAPKKKKSTEELLEEISAKIDKLIALIAIQGKSENHQIKILTDLGFDSKKVGILLNLPSGTVRRRNAKMKSKKE